LIFECVKDFQEECQEYIFNEIPTHIQGIEKIKAISKNYIKYFIEYPGIFELFYIEKTSEIESKQSTNELINKFLNRLCSEDWEYLKNEKIYTQEQSEIIQDQLNFIVVGLLLFFNHRKYPNTYREFLILVDLQLNSVLTL